MKQTNDKWAHSPNGEEYWLICDDRESAIAEGAEEAHDNNNPEFFIAPCILASVKDIAIEFTAADLRESNYSELPEDHDWPDATAEQDLDLQEYVKHAVHAWIYKHNKHPDWYSVGKVEELITTDHYEADDA